MAGFLTKGFLAVRFPHPHPRSPPGRQSLERKLTPSLMSLQPREGCSRWVFDPGIFGDCKRRGGVGSQRGTAHLSNPIAPLGDKPTLPIAGDQSVGAQGACPWSVRRWDLGRQAPAHSHGPRPVRLSQGQPPRPQVPSPRETHRRRSGAGHSGERQGDTRAPSARLKWTHDLNASQWL